MSVPNSGHGRASRFEYASSRRGGTQGGDVAPARGDAVSMRRDLLLPAQFDDWGQWLERLLQLEAALRDLYEACFAAGYGERLFAVALEVVVLAVDVAVRTVLLVVVAGFVRHHDDDDVPRVFLGVLAVLHEGLVDRRLKVPEVPAVAVILLTPGKNARTPSPCIVPRQSWMGNIVRYEVGIDEKLRGLDRSDVVLNRLTSGSERRD